MSLKSDTVWLDTFMHVNNNDSKCSNMLIYCTNSFDKMYSDIKHTIWQKTRTVFIIFRLKSVNTLILILVVVKCDETVQEHSEERKPLDPSFSVSLRQK